ncbi:hypothetical protein JCM8547_002645 [Rhodosporidiobolus lusitaniae]
MLGLALLLAQSVAAYQVLVSEQDEVRQVCSGMWSKGEQEPFIEVIFSPSSRGQIALVVYEWEDSKYLGVAASGADTENDWAADRTYICTLAAQEADRCEAAQLGRFITSASNPSNSTIFTTSVRFDSVASSPLSAEDKSLGTGPYRYDVERTGYYCVGTVPVVLDGAKVNTTFTGVVDFENAFKGHLPASEYPKVAFYKILFFIYLGFAIFWAALCYANRRDLLPLQRYISATVFFLVVEQLMVWRYWNALNEGIHEGVAGFYLFLVSALNAGRNSISLYLLTLASMGLSIVRPHLGTVLAKVRMLALLHFAFGLLYSLGTVAIPLEAAGFFVLFFVLPLALTLTSFLLWIMYSLSSIIADLGTRRQAFKKRMFTRLYYILLVASALMLLFFISSSSAFSARLSPSFPAQTWKTRWVLLDGWLSLLFAGVFFAVAFLWRPTSANRHLALGDELPGSEAEAYDVDALLSEGDREDAGELDNYAMGRLSREGGGRAEREGTVFEVGSEDEDDEDEGGKVRRSRRSAEKGEGEESKGLMVGDDEGDITNQHADEKQSGRLDDPPEYRSTYKAD